MPKLHKAVTKPALRQRARSPADKDLRCAQLAEPPAIIANVLAADASLQPLQIEFEPFLARTLATLVRGMLQA